jgi:hypothetical protein
MAGKQGWGIPSQSKKAHYFVNGMSLCRSWMFTGALDDSNHKSPDNCKKCMTIRNKSEPPPESK